MVQLDCMIYNHVNSNDSSCAILCLIIIIPLVPRSTIHIRLLLSPGPIQPTTLVIPDILVPGLTGKLARCRAALTRATEKDHLLLRQGFGKGVFLLE